MKTRTYIEGSLEFVAQDYYLQMLKKNFGKMGDYLDDKVFLISPLSEVKGKEAVVGAAKGLVELLDDIEIREMFSLDSKVMIAYDFFFKGDIGKLRAAALLTVKGKKIMQIELFYDGRPFALHQRAIFD